MRGEVTIAARIVNNQSGAGRGHARALGLTV